MLDAPTDPTQLEAQWLLRYADSQTQRGMLVELRRPFSVVGRQSSCDIVVQDSTVSGRHALLVQNSDGTLAVRDLNSTNGVYVNDERVDHECRLVHGDEVKFGAATCIILERGNYTEEAHDTQLDQAARTRRMLGQLLRGQGIQPVFQPIVTMGQRQVVGFEVLTRTDLPDCPKNPQKVFELAETYQLESLLSHVFRCSALEIVGCSPPDAKFFINVHPSELYDDQLILSLKQIRDRWPAVNLAAEIHESSQVAIPMLQYIRDNLTAIGVDFVFDDFGVGQSRLLELVDVAPSMLKFDISLIRELHTAPQSKRRLIESLVRLAHDQEITVLAEGVETTAEALACTDMGFDFAQGYYYGRPAPTMVNTLPDAC